MEKFTALTTKSIELTSAIRDTKDSFSRIKMIGSQDKIFDAMLYLCEICPSCSSNEYIVSAIISAYNSEEFIEECLTDLTSQTLGNYLQIIIVDANSPQSEKKIVQDFQKKYSNITYVRTPTRVGVYTAWNIGIRLAKAPAITPFSTNDRLRHNAYEMMLEQLNKRPHVALVYGNTRVTDDPHQSFENHTPSKSHNDFVWADFSYEELLRRSLVGPHPMWRTWVHHRIGYFDESYLAMADQEFWLRMGERFSLFHIPEFTGLYWMDDNALSNHAKSEMPIKEKEYTREMYKKRYPYRALPDASISIIIPVYNQANYTLKCLQQLAGVLDIPKYEVIIIDNASTDETPQILKNVTGNFKVITNKKNVGFTLACNQGAKEAQGDYLLFLNNDTEPLPDFLNHMLRAFKENTNIGAVGGQLIYPDGSTQESGAMVFSNGTALNFGRGKNPALPYLNRLAKVDYCSGACLLTPKKIFHKAGGFDPEYAPGYYEETDYCFQLRSLGLETVYEPAAKIIHHGSVSAGIDETNGMRRFLPINREKFKHKWENALSKHEPRPENIENIWTVDRDYLGQRVTSSEKQIGALPNANSSNTNKIVMVSNYLPRFDVGSSNTRIYHLVNMLTDLGINITYIYFHVTKDDGRYRDAMPGVETINLPGEPHEHAERITSLTPDILWLTNLWTPSFFKSMGMLMENVRINSPETKIILDTMDVHAKKYFRKYKLEKKQEDLFTANAFNELEKKYYPLADTVFVVTEVEKKELLELVSDSASINVIPNVHIENNQQRPFEKRQHLIFLGNFAINHNVDAVLHFVENIFPLIHKRRPQIQFHVLGRQADTNLRALEGPNVRIHGFVQDLENALAQYRIFVCPMTYGAGMKGKLGEAMSRGLPLVTTSIGAEGFGLTDGEQCFIADAPEEFALKVVHLYEDRIAWNNFSNKSRSLVMQKFSPKAISSKLYEIVKYLHKDHKKEKAYAKKCIYQYQHDKEEDERYAKINYHLAPSCDRLTLKDFDFDKLLLQKKWTYKRQIYSKLLNGITSIKSIKTPAISLIVISWRLHPDTLKNFQILKKQRDQNFELIFVDNGGHPSEFDELMPYIDTYVRLSTNTGAYLARNIGAVFAKAPILFFLEDDAIPADNIIQSHISNFREFKIIAARGACYFKDHKNPLNNLQTHYYLGDLAYPRFGDLEGNVSYDAKSFFKVGGWDDNIRFGHGGIDLSYRLLKIESDMRQQIYSPTPIIFHDYIRDEKHLKTKKEKQAQTWQYLKKKHGHNFDHFIRSWDSFKRQKDLIMPREKISKNKKSFFNLAEHYRRQGNEQKYKYYQKKALKTNIFE